MRTNFYNLVMMSSERPSIWKARITRRAIVVLVIAFVLSFCVTAAIGYVLQAGKPDDLDFSQLQAENQALEIENQSLEMHARMLDTDISRLEETSERIKKLLAAD